MKASMLAEKLISDGQLTEALHALQDAVRKDPSNAKYRIFLFQLLTVLGSWDRALTQLNVVGQLDAAALPMVQTYREAVQCEALRADIFSGQRLPVVFGEPAPWIALMIDALRLDASGGVQQAATARAKAFASAPTVGGTIDGSRFDWIADGDARLGPLLEAVVNGRYYWIPFHRIRRIEIEAPIDLRDAVWMPASFIWINGGETVGLIPTRYAGTVERNDNALLLARRTEWIENQSGAALGLGQRMLVSDVADYSLMDIRLIEFDAAPEEIAGSEAHDG